MPDAYNPWGAPVFPTADDNAMQPETFVPQGVRDWTQQAAPKDYNILSQIAGSLGKALMYPGQVAQSKEPISTEDMVAPAFNLASMLTLGAGAMPAEANSLRAGISLPMDEASRLARANQQGYTIDAYKGGQPYDWNTMPSKNWKGEIIKGTEDRVPQELTSINSPNADYAGFFSNQPEVANRFAAPYEHGAVWPAKLKFDNPLVIDAQGKHAAAFQFESIARDPKNNTLKELDQFKGAFKEGSPHDGVILKNTRDEGDVYIPRNPDQIRSRFAAFDPKNAGSGLLLGSLAGASALPLFVGDKR